MAFAGEGGYLGGVCKVTGGEAGRRESELVRLLVLVVNTNDYLSIKLCLADRN